MDTKTNKNIFLPILLIVLSIVSLSISGIIVYKSLSKPIANTSIPVELTSSVTPSAPINMTVPPITQQELDQGWYWGSEDQKKPGTPDMWIFTGKGTRSEQWQKPDLLEPEDATSFLCPTTEWVDCMPGGPNEGIRFECTEKFLSWAKVNCPNFKGAAL